MKAALYKNVFKFLVKQSSETIPRSENGRLFHARGLRRRMPDLLNCSCWRTRLRTCPNCADRLRSSKDVVICDHADGPVNSTYLDRYCLVTLWVV